MPYSGQLMKKLNVGIIGYGWAAGAHIDAINQGGKAQVSAVYSTRKLDSSEVSAKHGGTITVYNSLKAMLADPNLQVISVTS